MLNLYIVGTDRQGRVWCKFCGRGFYPMWQFTVETIGM